MKLRRLTAKRKAKIVMSKSAKRKEHDARKAAEKGFMNIENQVAPNVFQLLPGELILNKYYPIYPEYVYIVDNVITQWNNKQTTVEYLLNSGRVREIRRCELFNHPGARIGDIVR